MSVYVKICRAITGSKISFDVLNCSKEQIHILKNGERKKMSMKNIFEKVAEQHNTTTEEVYSEIQRAINAGFDARIFEDYKRIHDALAPIYGAPE